MGLGNNGRQKETFLVIEKLSTKKSQSSSLFSSNFCKVVVLGNVLLHSTMTFVVVIYSHTIITEGQQTEYTSLCSVKRKKRKREEVKSVKDEVIKLTPTRDRRH